MGGKIYWTKDNHNGEMDFEREPPYPSFNELEDKITASVSCYVNQKMMLNTLDLFNKASEEIVVEDNRLRKTIEEIEAENRKLKEQLNKWVTQQGKGKRTSKKILSNADEIKAWKEAGTPTREIARRLKVSEGTIRHFLKK